jgi:glutathione S-transferase
MIARLALNESNIHFDTKYMDIHIAKDQIAPWYIAVNPSMTVPTLTAADHAWKDSRDILKFAAMNKTAQWYDSDPTIAPQIEKIVAAHYAISIEELTFGKIMVNSFLARKLFPIMLGRINKQLKAESEVNPLATQEKIEINERRLAYFTQGNLVNKLNDRKEEVRDFINQLPQPDKLLFGDKASSADIVTAILYARLNMIDEYDLMKSSPAVSSWFDRMKTRPAFLKSDVWLQALADLFEVLK